MFTQRRSCTKIIEVIEVRIALTFNPPPPKKSFASCFNQDRNKFDLRNIKHCLLF